MQSDTPWRVRDNIALFVREIEERTGYLKLGVTVVSDSNPGNIARQKEFAIGGVLVTSSAAPKSPACAIRHRSWLPLRPIGAAGYLTASYVDYPEQDFDRLTVDAGPPSRNLVESGRVTRRGRPAGSARSAATDSTAFPMLAWTRCSTRSWSRTGWRSGSSSSAVTYPDFEYLDSTYRSEAFDSLRRELSRTVAGTLRGSVEGSHAEERPYSYYGWDIAPGISTFWPPSTCSWSTRA